MNESQDLDLSHTPTTNVTHTSTINSTARMFTYKGTPRPRGRPRKERADSKNRSLQPKDGTAMPSSAPSTRRNSFMNLLPEDTEQIYSNKKPPLSHQRAPNQPSRLRSLLCSLRDFLRGRQLIIAKALSGAVLLVLVLTILKSEGVFGPGMLLAALAGEGLGGAVRAFQDGYRRGYEHWGEEAIIARRWTGTLPRFF